jgi:hypothetical protein
MMRNINRCLTERLNSRLADCLNDLHFLIGRRLWSLRLRYELGFSSRLADMLFSCLFGERIGRRVPADSVSTLFQVALTSCRYVDGVGAIWRLALSLTKLVLKRKPIKPPAHPVCNSC